MFIDTHAHIYAEEFDKDRADIIEQGLIKGVKKIYMPNVDEESIDRMLEAEDRYKDVCIPMMGLHPCSVGKDFEKQLYIIEDWLKRRKFAAVGEIGIDLFHDVTWFEQQKEAFKIQVQWSIDYNLPIVIHCRNSFKETLEELEKMGEQAKGIFHCFSGTIEDALLVTEMGFLLGIGGVSTFKNGGLDKVLPNVDLKNVVLETDSPYLAPTPHRGKRNTPEFIPLIAQKVGDIKQVSLEDVARITTSNARNIFAEV